jgi:hypothetical protein
VPPFPLCQMEGDGMPPDESQARIMVLGNGPPGLAAFTITLLQRATPKPRIVILSKDPGHIVAALLQREGHQLQRCTSREALEVASAIGPDLLVVENEVLNGLIEELRSAQEHLRALSGLIPICSYCKKVRKRDGEWEAIDIYLGRLIPGEFTHTLCPQHRVVTLNR